MSPSLQKRFNSLEAQRKQLQELLRQVSTEKLLHQPQGRWSIAQIVAHLITAERLSIAYVNKKILAINEVKDAGMVEHLKMIILIISQRLPFKFKAPRLVVEKTISINSLTQLEQEWDEARKELIIVLDKIPDHQSDRKIYKHVLAGMLSMKQGLTFFREHIIHHQPQIRKLL